MSITSRIFCSTKDLPLEDWERIRNRCNGNIFMDHRFLSVVETTMGDVVQVWYVLFYDGSGEPIACACLSTFRVDLAIIAGSGTRRILERLRRLAPSLLYMKVMFCGLPVSLGQKGVLFTPEAEVMDVLAELDELTIALANEHNAWLIVYKEHSNEDLDDLQILIKRGYRRAESLSMHIFNESFRDFEHYLSNLKSHYRYDISRSRRKLERAGVQIVRWNDADVIRAVYTPELHQLYLAVVNNAENRLETLPCEFFRELARQFPQEIALVGLVKDGRVFAFNWSLATTSTYQFLFCGIDYAANRNMDLYFNVMYAELGYGLQLGLPEIIVGQTSDHFKARLGCRQRPLYLFVKGTGGITDLLLHLSFPLLFPSRPAIPSADIYNSRYKAT